MRGDDQSKREGRAEGRGDRLRLLAALAIPMALSLLLGSLTADAEEALMPRVEAPAASSEEVGPPPQRIVSLALPADELLLELVEPSRIAALTSFVDDSEASNAREAARRVPGRVTARAEAVLSLRPDLVVAAPYTDPATLSLLRRLGVRVHLLPHPESIAALLEGIRGVGRAVHEEEGAEALVRDFEARQQALVARLRGVERPSLLLYTYPSGTAGAGTLFDEVLRLAGGRNAAAEAGIEGRAPMPLSSLIRLDPSHILLVRYEADARARSLLPAPRFSEDPRFSELAAVRNGRVLSLPARGLLTTSHHRIEGAEALARALHPARFSGEPEPAETGLEGGTR